MGKFIEEYYNEIEISYTAAKAHPKSAFQMRNRELVDRADLVICYIENKEGGAWQTIKYAKEKEKNIINLAEYMNIQEKPVTRESYRLSYVEGV